MAQKTIDFENNILKPIGSLKEDIVRLKDNKITKFYTNNNGDTALNDSDDGKIQDLMIYGKSEQKQYTGTNLLQIIKKPSGNYGGVSITTKEDGTIVLNGTSTRNVDHYLVGSYSGEEKYTFDTTKTYTIRKMPTGVGLYIGANSIVKKNITNSDLVTSGFSFGFVLLRCIEGRNFKNTEVKVQINEGTTLLDYEPYVGGKPSPSPEYPQEIKAVVNPTIKIHGVNILDIKDVAERVDNDSGLTYSVQKGIIKVKGTSKRAANIQIPFLHNTRKKLIANNTYIFNPNPTKKAESFASFLDFTNNVTLGISITNSNIDKPVKMSESQVLHEFVLNIKVQKDTQIDMEWKPQLLLSNTLLPYQPYQETQATLPYELNAIPVSSGGNVTIDGQQYIADYVDVERGKLVRMTELIEYDGTENWSLQSINNNGIANFQIIATRYIGSIGMCDTLQLQKTIISNTNTEGFMINNNNSLFIRINTTRGISTLETFKEFLANKHIFILYALSTPTEIDLVKEEITAFKALSTYYPKTYINAESEQLEAYTMFNYPVSMEKGWEYVKQQIGDTRKYMYDMDTKTQDIDTQSAEAYVNSEYAVALTELEV